MAIARDEKAQQTSPKKEQKTEVSSLSEPKNTKIDYIFDRLLADEQLCKKLNLDPFAALKNHYDIPERKAKSKMFYFVTKSFTEANILTESWDKCNRISEDLVLMKIISENECDEIIKMAEESTFGHGPKKRVGLVISAVDYFEMGGSPGFIDKIATPSSWEIRGIEQVMVPIMDFGAKVLVEALLNVQAKIQQCRDRGQLIAVHCKAGRGRSTMICVIDLALSALEDNFLKEKDLADKHDLKLILEKENLIKKYRPHVGLNKPKLERAVQTIRVVKMLWNTLAEEKVASEAVDSKESKEAKQLEEKPLNNLLSSLQAKFDISQMIFFKELAIYAAKEKELLVGTTKRTKYIKDFFNVIYKATDDSWFYDFDKHMQPLLDANPNFKTIEDKLIRSDLVKGFKQELTAYFKVMKGATPKTIATVRLEAFASAKAVSRALIREDSRLTYSEPYDDYSKLIF